MNINLSQGKIVIISGGSENLALVMDFPIYKRAKGGEARASKLKNPVEKRIGGTFLVFKPNEWKKVEELYFSDREIFREMREEIREKAGLSKRLSKYRDLRAVIDANTFAARELENHHTRVRPTK